MKKAHFIFVMFAVIAGINVSAEVPNPGDPTFETANCRFQSEVFKERFGYMWVSGIDSQSTSGTDREADLKSCLSSIRSMIIGSVISESQSGKGLDMGYVEHPCPVIRKR